MHSVGRMLARWAAEGVRKLAEDVLCRFDAVNVERVATLQGVLIHFVADELITTCAIVHVLLWGGDGWSGVGWGGLGWGGAG